MSARTTGGLQAPDFRHALLPEARFGPFQTRCVDSGPLPCTGRLAMADPFAPGTRRVVADVPAGDHPTFLVLAQRSGISVVALAGVQVGGPAERWQPGPELWSDSGLVALLDGAASLQDADAKVAALPARRPLDTPAGPWPTGGVATYPAGPTGHHRVWLGWNGAELASVALDFGVLVEDPDTTVVVRVGSHGLAPSPDGWSVAVEPVDPAAEFAELRAALGPLMGDVEAPPAGVSVEVRGPRPTRVRVAVVGPDGPVDAGEQVANLEGGRRFTLLGDLRPEHELVVRLPGERRPLRGSPAGAAS